MVDLSELFDAKVTVRSLVYWLPRIKVKDIDDWNAYSWGEYIWRRLYEKIVNVAVDTPILERPKIVGEVLADQELDLGAVEGNFELRELVAKVPAHVVAKDAIVERPKLVDEVRAHIVAKDAIVEKEELVDEVSSDREVATLKTILASVEKFPDQSVNNDSEGKLFHTNDAKTMREMVDCCHYEESSEIDVPIDINAEDGKLNYLHPGAYQDAMMENEGENTNKYSIDAILVKRKEDDCEDDKVGDAMLEKEVYEAHPDDEKVREAVLDSKENNTDKYSIAAISVQGKKDDCVEMDDVSDDGVIDVDVWTEVYFPSNVLKDHYFLVVLQIRDGVVTFYDSIGIPPQETRHDFLKMRVTLELALPKYLDLVRVFKTKGIPIEDDKITFPLGENVNVPIQAEPYGDCEVWVCIFLYRLSHNLTLEVDDPLQVALAYREHMAKYFW
nr:ulp1 protease family, C-terminal catalytic domain-containing protein [Tanacetum cinerariifolium]